MHCSTLSAGGHGWVTAPIFPAGAVALMLLLFPDGHLPSRRWKPLAATCVVVTAVIVPVSIFYPGPLSTNTNFATPNNPMGLPVTGGLEVAVQALGLLWLPGLALFLAAAIAPLVRMRRAAADERQQLKWIAYAVIVTATAIVAVGFQPVRERLQRVANRLVYGKRATPYEVLSQFSERVAESYASDAVLPRMARVLAEGTSADLAEVWLRSGDVLRRAAVFPAESAAPEPVQLDSAQRPTVAHADRTVEVRHQGQLLGALIVTKRRGESLTPIEIKLMDDLAHQAGLVLKNVGLTADLQARLEDLRASRQRLVAAQDDERRRLERNLHDGAQQHLVAIKVKVGLAEMLLTRDPDKARATIVALVHDADEARETLRDLARGIYPPLLAERGLAAALQSQAGKATLPVHVDADGVGRYPQETEAALYFCTLEALQNVQKYAAASAVQVRLREDANELLVTVVDDGRGFDVLTAVRGAGLTNMEDRLNALGGTLHIDSTPGTGTTLCAAVPILDEARSYEPAGNTMTDAFAPPPEGGFDAGEPGRPVLLRGG